MSDSVGKWVEVEQGSSSHVLKLYHHSWPRSGLCGKKTVTPTTMAVPAWNTSGLYLEFNSTRSRDKMPRRRQTRLYYIWTRFLLLSSLEFNCKARITVDSKMKNRISQNKRKLNVSVGVCMKWWECCQSVIGWGVTYLLACPTHTIHMVSGHGLNVKPLDINLKTN